MKTRDKIYIGIIIVVLFGTVFIMNRIHKKETSRLENNYKALLAEKGELVENGRQQIIKEKEYKEIYKAKYDSLTKELDIRRRNIETITVTRYKWKDTTVVKHETVYDNVSNVDKFSIQGKCYDIQGEYFEGFVTVKSVEFEDKLTSFTCKDFDKKFLFFKWKPFYTTKVYSQCKGDTVSIEENIKIVKNSRRFSWR